MYRLMIVDDEAEIRDGLRTIDWASLGIELVCSCEHGMEAFQKILSDPIDIVITDIRMPFMDGLKLVENVSRHFPFIKTLILTGYDDFSYAQQGIRYGVFDYLLKPTKLADLHEALRKVVAALDQDKQQEFRTRALERKAYLSAKVLRHNFLKKLFVGPLTLEEIEEGCSEGELIFEKTCYTVCKFRLDQFLKQRDSYSLKDFKLILFALDNVLAELWDDKGHGYHLVDQDKGDCFILSVSNECDHNMLMGNMEVLKKELSRFRGLFLSTLSFGIGYTVHDCVDIYISSEQAGYALQGESNRVVVFDPARNSPMEKAPLRKQDNTITMTEKEAEGNETESHLIIGSAKKYIEGNFMHSITLAEVASQVHVSPNYLSFLFKKVTGENITHYLTSYRIQRAVELLHDPQYKVYEIGEMVGYANPGYFSEIFKKYTGKNPHDYRH